MSAEVRAIDDIVIGPCHRCDMGDVEALAASIRDLGLLQPIVITPDGHLLAGERRLCACRLRGWSEIPVVVKLAALPFELRDEVAVASIVDGGGR